MIAVEVQSFNGWAKVAEFADRQAAITWSRGVLRSAKGAIFAVRVGKAEDEPSIFDLYRKVTEHPEFVAGSVWCRCDFAEEGLNADAFDARHFTDNLIQYGNEILELHMHDDHSDQQLTGGR